MTSRKEVAMVPSRQLSRHDDSLEARAARTALLQRRRGSHEAIRALYYKAHSLLRALNHYLHLDLPRAA
jgi:hypothetical protein